MLTFIIRRVLWTVLVMFVITVVVFIIFFKTPGVDPARAIAGRNPSAQVLQEIRAQFGLDKPLPVQYLLMMKSIFISRDLVSYSNQGVKVVPEIAAATPATLSLVFGIHGVGFLAYQGFLNLDLPTIMATVVYGAFFIVLANALVDIAYAWLDPRIRPS